MTTNFPIDVQMQSIDTLCSVFHYKKDFVRFLKSADLPKSTLKKLEVAVAGNTTKRDALGSLFDEVLNLPDNQGMGPINQMLKKLVTWSNFSSSIDPQKAQKDVQTLAAMLQARSQKKNALKQKKEKREQKFESQQASINRVAQQDQLKSRYFDLFKSTNPQARGLEFERTLLQDIFQFEQIKSVEPFVLQGEQIDGAIEFDTEHYLIESKWTQNKIGPEHVSWFNTKIERKLRGTRGLIIAINGFTDEAIRTATESRCIILMDGDDLYYVVETSNSLSFKDLLQRKIAEFAQKGNPFIKARQIMNEKQYIANQLEPVMHFQNSAYNGSR